MPQDEDADVDDDDEDEDDDDDNPREELELAGLACGAGPVPPFCKGLNGILKAMILLP